MTLLEEIIAKCSPEQIAAREHGEIAATVSSGRTTIARVPIADIQDYMQTHGIWWVLKAAAADVNHPGQQAAIAVLDVAEARYSNINTQLSIVGYMLGGLVASGVMAQADLDAITAMGVVPAPVSVQDVVAAMEGV